MRDVPQITISRFPQYLRALIDLQECRVNTVSSRVLGLHLEITPAQIRKDLSYFGHFGKQGKGYNVKKLIREIRAILGLGKSWNVGIIGVGRLGRAIISYTGFEAEGFRITSAFDKDTRLIGQMVGGLLIKPLSQLSEEIQGNQIQLAILAVPSSETQSVTDRIVASGVKAILSYSSSVPKTPTHVQVRTLDPIAALQSMTYHLKGNM